MFIWLDHLVNWSRRRLTDLRLRSDYRFQTTLHTHTDKHVLHMHTDKHVRTYTHTQIHTHARKQTDTDTQTDRPTDRCSPANLYELRNNSATEAKKDRQCRKQTFKRVQQCRIRLLFVCVFARTCICVRQRVRVCDTMINWLRHFIHKNSLKKGNNY